MIDPVEGFISWEIIFKILVFPAPDWALESHRVPHTLQELLTIKSDDVRGRTKAFESIIKGIDIPQSSVPESFHVLVKELNALGLSIDYAK